MARLSAAELTEALHGREVYEITGQESHRLHIVTKRGDQVVEYLDVYHDANGIPVSYKSVTSRVQWDLNEAMGRIYHRKA